MDSLQSMSDDQYSQLCNAFRRTTPFIARTFFWGLRDIQPSEECIVEYALDLASANFSLLAENRQLECELEEAIQKQSDGYLLLVNVRSWPVVQETSIPMLGIAVKAYVGSRWTARVVAEKPLLHLV